MPHFITSCGRALSQHIACDFEASCGPGLYTESRDYTMRFPYHLSISLGHTLRCYTPSMLCSDGAAMPQHCMHCAAIKSLTCPIFYNRFQNMSAVYHRFSYGFQHSVWDLMGFHVISDTKNSHIHISYYHRSNEHHRRI